MTATTTSTTASLRSRKKAETRAALLAEAQRVVRASGLAGLRVSVIAARAGVSEASFYNYFGSRDALLSEWAHQSLALALAAIAASAGAVETSTGASLRGRLRTPLREYGRRIAEEAPLMRELWRRTALLPDRSAPGAPLALYDAFTGEVRAAQTSGELRADLSADELADALRVAAGAAVVRALVSVGDDGASVTPGLLRAVDLVLDGARKRNERVRPERRNSPA